MTEVDCNFLNGITSRQIGRDFTRIGRQRPSFAASSDKCLRDGALGGTDDGEFLTFLNLNPTAHEAPPPTKSLLMLRKDAGVNASESALDALG